MLQGILGARWLCRNLLLGTLSPRYLLPEISSPVGIWPPRYLTPLCLSCVPRGRYLVGEVPRGCMVRWAVRRAVRTSVPTAHEMHYPGAEPRQPLATTQHAMPPGASQNHVQTHIFPHCSLRASSVSGCETRNPRNIFLDQTEPAHNVLPLDDVQPEPFPIHTISPSHKHHWPRRRPKAKGTGHNTVTGMQVFEGQHHRPPLTGGTPAATLRGSSASDSAPSAPFAPQQMASQSALLPQDSCNHGPPLCPPWLPSECTWHAGNQSLARLEETF